VIETDPGMMGYPSVSLRGFARMTKCPSPYSVSSKSHHESHIPSGNATENTTVSANPGPGGTNRNNHPRAKEPTTNHGGDNELGPLGTLAAPSLTDTTTHNFLLSILVLLLFYVLEGHVRMWLHRALQICLFYNMRPHALPSATVIQLGSCSAEL
jgi:hypothetical protein